MPRLLIYNTEANSQSAEAQQILHGQFATMMKRLWFGITWPSAILTLILGLSVLWKGNWFEIFASQSWLHIKLLFVLLLYGYHFSLHYLMNQQLKGIFRYSSQQLRFWNEVATIFLVTIVMLVVVKQNMSAVWGLVGLFGFVILLMSAIKVYKRLRKN
jgi:putative membrane protein